MIMNRERTKFGKVVITTSQISHRSGWAGVKVANHATKEVKEETMVLS